MLFDRKLVKFQKEITNKNSISSQFFQTEISK